MAKKTTKKPAAKKPAAKKKTTKKKDAAPKTTSGRSRVLKKKPKAPAKPAKKAAAAKAGGGKAKKLSAIDAAAKVLATAKEPMNAKQLIEAMAARKLWTSPGGKTPHATLYSAILREIQTKGKDARFKKAERGKFTANG